MERGSCASGSFWDSLTKQCISHTSYELRSSITDVPTAVVKSVLSGRDAGESWSAVGLSVWICVGLVVTGSLLVLIFWFIIYKHHSRTSQNTAGQKDDYTAVTSQQEVLHLNGQLQEVSITEATCGRSLCNGWAEHVLPLPATELGDSALVTTKTGQPVEV
ncbi:tumor necrosis factor receptor superfamily member 17-like isoform X1 [Misgurnus anguillicaudatus]|uniref:tumor necrosis factor receptor superfamily member 17-like isoform X1 n=1 Tax=Misgurnus anguillicaudatus TaxID=75329 RepID=UPI0024360F9C|nr:tumor necrosis factor receptor superfamily member 17-like isoform X1 [Misgurnus anguillicaudatus]